MVAGWTTDFVRFPDGRFRVCHDPSVLATRIHWGKSWHDFSGPHTVEAAVVIAREILMDCPHVLRVTIQGFDGTETVVFAC